jgi:hypothetical protein
VVNARSTASFRYPEGLRGNKIGLSADVALCPGYFLTDIGNPSKFKGFTVTRCPAMSGCVGLFWQTLNQRVQGSSPCAPTIDLQSFLPLFSQNILYQLGAQLGDFVLFSSFRMALSPSAGSRAR